MVATTLSYNLIMSAGTVIRKTLGSRIVLVNRIECRPDDMDLIIIENLLFYLII